MDFESTILGYPIESLRSNYEEVLPILQKWAKQDQGKSPSRLPLFYQKKAGWKRKKEGGDQQAAASPSLGKDFFNFRSCIARLKGLVLRDGPNVPNLLGIFADRPVGGKSAGVGQVGQAFSGPAAAVPVVLIDPLLSFRIGLEII